MNNQTDHRREAEQRLGGFATRWTPTENLLAAIHDEQQAQTGLLTDLRGAIDDLAETLRPKGDPCPCGCRRDVEPKERATGTAQEWAEHFARVGRTLRNDPEPESVTVTLPERILGRPWTVAELRMLAEWADNAGSGEAGTVLGHVADALDAASATQEATSAPLTAQEPTEAPADGEGTERPTGANLRVGWLRWGDGGRCLVREVPRGWSHDQSDAPDHTPEGEPDATFTPLTPADFGWTVLGEGQVAVERMDVTMAVTSAERHERPLLAARLRAALDGES